MSTQNLNTGPLRSSGHKEATSEHATVEKMKTQGDGGDTEALLQNRILNNSQVDRAAIYDHEDFLCVGSSTKRFKVEPDDIRKILDGLLTFSRVGDPTAAGGAGEPPKHITIGSEGRADVTSGDGERIIASLNGKIIIAARTARHVVLVEGKEGANQGSLETTVQSFQEGLQVLT